MKKDEFSLQRYKSARDGKSMFSHITVGTNEIERAARFYDSLLSPLGLTQRATEPDGGPEARCWVMENCPLPRFYVYEPFDKGAATAGNGTMVAFEANPLLP